MTDGLTIARTFAAPRERVFRAWTTPEDFSIWFGTDGVDVPLETLSMDVRTGGIWKATMHIPDGPTINWTGEYIAVDPPSFVSFTMTDQPDDPAREPVTVSLIETADGGTEMVMTQSGGNLTEEQYAQTVIGYNAFFDVMERLVTSQD
ncbi:SRPBCC domain-containing protein [Glaciihabitans sp. dw_435]|uniref:SRPBCC family protein n=1 Tax=Glaciihabitans sp. dw_435 TaxID=2720081 RepID=UPI001BD24BE1|nr:SRPBCC domain-containing protein [Glaciihabitans sp. dw_435]